ncbi:hypothetical protein [Nocardiopsis tropica]|uniref:Uncharacterized protein n=1 Tax=Nocardiopsis tropica TaxID=109330 RepID=A0ABU7KK18_9ACTN|nr:hypothetical protein [Nocardiopsis umidischolae]MEE2049640.1 hypothetical protein [Nocardiopsis umidischolae]
MDVVLDQGGEEEQAALAVSTKGEHPDTVVDVIATTGVVGPAFPRSAKQLAAC